AHVSGRRKSGFFWKPLMPVHLRCLIPAPGSAAGNPDDVIAQTSCSWHMTDRHAPQHSCSGREATVPDAGRNQTFRYRPGRAATAHEENAPAWMKVFAILLFAKYILT